MYKASRWLAILGVVVLVVGAMVLAGCGGTTTTTAGAETTTSVEGAGAYDINAVLAGITADPALTAMLPANIVSAGEMKVASDIPYPPWEMYVGDTKQATGFDYDLSQAIAAKLGV